MRFALVVPALNEEGAIAGTLRRCLAARAKVVAETPVQEMFVVFVNDGSTDRTQEIVEAPEFVDVIKVRFERNRGYGAAIKAGWKATDAELVGFIDGDGTCDPDFCVPLVKQLIATKADVVLAGRMNPESKMPPVRKLGNAIFARLLAVLSGRILTDSASGFRIVRRASLSLIAPLPDRLNFTPAMSCTCLFDPRLKIAEVPMPYEERIGQSKLHVIKDGFRFLFTICFAAFFYAPLRMMLYLSGGLFVFFGGLIGILSRRAVSGEVLLGFGLLGALMIVSSLTLGLLHHQISFFLLGPRREVEAGERRLQTGLQNERLLGWGAVVWLVGLVAFSVLGLGTGSEAPLRAGTLIAAGLLSFLGGLGFMGGLALRAVGVVRDKQDALREDEYRAMTSTPGSRSKEHERRS